MTTLNGATTKFAHCGKRALAPNSVFVSRVSSHCLGMLSEPHKLLDGYTIEKTVFSFPFALTSCYKH